MRDDMRPIWTSVVYLRGMTICDVTLAVMKNQKIDARQNEEKFSMVSRPTWKTPTLD